MLIIPLGWGGKILRSRWTCRSNNEWREGGEGLGMAWGVRVDAGREAGVMKNETDQGNKHQATHAPTTTTLSGNGRTVSFGCVSEADETWQVSHSPPSLASHSLLVAFSGFPLHFGHGRTYRRWTWVPCPPSLPDVRRERVCVKAERQRDRGVRGTYS